MKNTNNSIKIKQRNITSKKLIGGIIVFSLLSSLTFSRNQKSDIDYQEGEAMYSFYKKTYYNALNDLNDSDFSPLFNKIYNSKLILIGNTAYELGELYIEKSAEGKVYLKKAGEDIDILTNSTIPQERDKYCQFRNSTIFYNLFLSRKLYPGLRISKEDLQSTIGTWDGKTHDKIKELYAEKIAKTEYQKKYGK